MKLSSIVAALGLALAALPAHAQGKVDPTSIYFIANQKK